MKTPSSRILLTAASVLTSIFPPTDVHAQLTWSAGSGNWSTTDANWTNPSPAPSAWINGSSGIINSASNLAITLTEGLTVEDLTTTGAGNKDVSSSAARTLTLAFGDGVAAFSVTNGRLLFNGNINFAGNGNIVKSGNGLLHFQGIASTYTGNIFINAGQLQINADGGLGNTGNDIYLNGGTLQQNTASPVTLPTGRVIHLGDGITASGGTINTFSRTINVAGVIQDGGSGAGFLTKTGGNAAGVLELRAANTYSGTTTHKLAGVLRLTNNGTFGSGAGDLDLGGTALTEINRGNTYSLDNRVIGGAGGTILRQSGTGRTILTNAFSTFGGVIEVANGVLEMQAGTTGGSAPVVVNGGALEVTGDVFESGPPAATSTIAAGAVLRGTAKIERDFQISGKVEPGTAITPITPDFGINGDVEFLAGSSLDLQMNGSTIDTLAIDGNLTATTTPINLTLLGTPTPGTYTIITYTGFLTGGFTAPAGMTLDTATVGEIKLVVPVPAPENLTWVGNISGDWDGVTQNWNDGGGPDLFETLDNVTFADGAFTGTISIPGSVQPGAVVFSSTGANDFTFGGAGKISGPTGITKTGDATVTLSTANDFSGSVTINAGRLVLGNGTALGNTTGSTTIAPGATLSLLADADVAENISGGGTLERDGSAFGRTLSGDLSGFTGDVVVKTSNRMGILPSIGAVGMPSGAASFTVEDDGAIRFRQSATFASGTEFDLTCDGFNAGGPLGTLIADNGANVVVGGPVVMNAGAFNGNCLITSDAGATLTLEGGVSGGANFVKEGTALVLLNSAASHTGSTWIANGTLQLGAAGALPSGAVMKLGKPALGAVLLLNGKNQTVSGLKGLGSGGGFRRISNGAATPSVFTANITTLDPDFNEDGTTGDDSIWDYDHTIGSSTITDTANRNLSFVKSGSGALAVANAHYDGATTVAQGVLGIYLNSTLTQPIDVENGGTLMSGIALGVAVNVDAGGALGAGNLLPNPLVANSSPIGSVGTMGVAGFNLATGSNLLVQLDSSLGTMDRINSTSAVSLGSANLVLSDLAGAPAALPAGNKFVIVNYTGQSLTGTFAGLAENSTVTIGANTFVIRYADTDDGLGNPGLYVTLEVSGGDAYDSWVAGRGLTGPAAAYEADPDGDGVANGLEFILGGEPNPANPGSNSASLLPTVENISGDLLFSFRRKDISEGIGQLVFQWSTGLTFPPANDVPVGATDSATGGITVDITEDSPSADTDSIIITVPAVNAVGGKLFGRLKASRP